MRYLLAVLLALPFCLSVHAETITDLITFRTLSGYSGSFTLTFDPTLSYADNTTAGLVVNSLSPSRINIPSGFNYSATGPDAGKLSIGGLADGVQDMPLGTDDYGLVIMGMNTKKPSFNLFAATSSLDDNYLNRNIIGTLTVKQLAAVTPEPSSFMLLGTGLLGLAGVVKRRLA